MSKGSARRPIDPKVERKVFEDNWDRIFNKERKDLSYESDNPLERPFEPQLERIEEKIDELVEFFDGMENKMWQHYCQHNGHMAIAKGEACSWCGVLEDGSLD
jgi:hypothetical protein